jgi:hypothetical protein
MYCFSSNFRPFLGMPIFSRSDPRDYWRKIRGSPLPCHILKTRTCCSSTSPIRSPVTATPLTRSLSPVSLPPVQARFQIFSANRRREERKDSTLAAAESSFTYQSRQAGKGLLEALSEKSSKVSSRAEGLLHLIITRPYHTAMSSGSGGKALTEQGESYFIASAVNRC